MHKKTVKKKGKVFGPYYYTTVRARDGSVKTHYLGVHEGSARNREREIHLSYRQKRRRLPSLGPLKSKKILAPALLVLIALIASAFLITMPSEPGLYTIITNRDVPFDGQREVVFHDYKFSNNGNIILLSRNVHHCTWYPDSSPKKDLKHCRLIVEVEDWNDEAISMDDYTLSFRGLEEYSPRYLYSDQYTTYYEILDDSVRNETTRRIIREHYLKIQRRSWSGYRPLDSITLDTSKPFSILAEFEMPKYQEEHFDVEVALQGRTLSLDPTVSVCGDIDSSGVYTMNQSLESAADCIAIKSDDVIFDMAGFNITGLGPMYAINVSSSGATNITIRNGMTVIPDYGILVEAGGGLITNMTFNTGNGIKATGGGPFTVQYCTFDTDRGIHIESTLGTIRDNNFTNPGDYGVIDYTFGTGDNHIINNTFNGATNAAIDLTGTGNNVTNNSFTANVNDIRLNENSQIIADNTHFNCTGTACILLIGSDYSTITGEFINISDYGVHVDGDSSFNNISVESYQAAIADIYILGLDNRINGSFHSSVGVEIAGSVTTTYLYDNTTCTGTCFNITANNVTLDGAGHLINYSTDGGNSEYGVYVNGYNQTTIKNAIIEQGLATGSSDHAILFGNSSNGTIQNNTITTSGTGGAGIYFYLGSNSNNITSNTITTSGSSAHGIASVASSDSSITSNTITTSGIATIGIRLHSSSDSSITSNTIDASEGSGQGISLMSNSDLLIVTNNTIESSGMGLILSSVSNSSITNNTITSPERGVYVYLSSDNIISGGTVNSSTAYSIYVDSGSDSNNITDINFLDSSSPNAYIAGNNNRINGSFNSNVGIEIAGASTTTYLSGDSSCTGTCFNITANNVVLDFNNYNITGDGSGEDYGVYAEGRNNITIKNFNSGNGISAFQNAIYFTGTNNSFIENLTANSNTQHGIYLVSSSNNNTLTDITANFNANVYSGIYIDSGDNNILTRINADSNTEHGIYISGNNNQLINVTASNNTWYESSVGLYVSGTGNRLITENSQFNNNSADGIYWNDDCVGCSLTNVEVSDNTVFGLRFGGDVNSSVFTNITTNNNGDEGFIIGQGDGNNFTSIVSNNNVYFGLQITADNSVFTNISASNNAGYGLSVSGTGNRLITENSQFNNNSGVWIGGIYWYGDCVECSLTNVEASDNYGIGMYFGELNDSILTNITANNNVAEEYDDYGIYLFSGSNNNLTGITANGNGAWGIYLYESSNNNILINITASNNTGYGLYVSGTGNRLITENSQFNNNSVIGIGWFYDCVECSLTNVEANDNYGIGISFSGITNSTFTNITTNNNVAAEEIQDSYGFELYSSSNNNILTGITANGNRDYGVLIGDNSNNNIFTGITANSNTQDGISIFSSSNNIIRDSNLSSNTLNDTYLSSTSINNTFLNVTYTNEYVASGSELIRKWYYRAYVNDTDGNDVASANVTAYNTSGDLVEYSTTNSSGWVNIHLTEYTNVGGTTSWYSNYTIYANKTLYTNASKVRNISVDQNILNDYLTISGVPTVQSVALNTSGDTNLTTQNPECWATPSDPEESTLTAYVNWWNGSQHMPGLFTSKASVANATPTLVSTLGSGNTTNTDTWMCSVIFDDGTGNSTSWSNASLLVLINLDNLAVNVETNASVYEQGEAALITVTLSNSDTEQITGNLSITIEDYDDNQVSVNYYNGTAVYASTTTTKQDVNSTTGWAGVYNITAVFSVPGGYSKQTSLTFTIFAEMPHSLQVKLRINNTQGTVYVPGTGELAVSSMSNATYASPTHYYLASYASDVLKSLVFAQGTAIALVVNRSTTTEHILEVNQYLNNSVYYLAFTEGDWNLVDKRMELIEQGRFMTEIAPSFAYGLGTKCPIKVLLEYTTLDLVNNHILQKGYHKIVFESNSTNTEGASVIIRTP